MARLNITLPDEIAEKIANKQNKSRFIAEALREKIERDKKKKIEDLLIEGYKTTIKEDSAILTEWEGTDLEEWK